MSTKRQSSVSSFFLPKLKRTATQECKQTEELTWEAEDLDSSNNDSTDSDNSTTDNIGDTSTVSAADRTTIQSSTSSASQFPDKFPGPNDISLSASAGPMQPKLKYFPLTKYGNRWRHFQDNWYRIYPWLEYSVSENSVYCFSCRFFSTETSNESNTFYSKGYGNWKKAMNHDSGIKLHNSSTIHKTSMVKWASYKHLKDSGDSSVVSQLSEANKKHIEENRYYISTIAEVLLLTATQRMAQCGNDESVSSCNQGNFLEILSFVSKHDPRIKAKLEMLPANAKYTHHSVQDELLKIMSLLVLKKISYEVKAAEYFALIADETKDISKQEQFSVVIRYYLNGSIHERFLGYQACTTLNAESLLNYIKKVLSECSVDLNMCVAQTYDGASVMSGKLNGVQTLLRKEVPQAMYVHCMNHKLNLVLVDTCKNIYEVTRFFTLLEQLYVFTSRSTIHPLFIDLQKKLKKQSERVYELKRLSDTRWVCQITACLAVKNTFSIILLLLNQLSSQESEKGVEAKGILSQLDFRFLFCLNLFCEVLNDVKIVSDYLQKHDSDLAVACTLTETLADTLQKYRDDDEYFLSVIQNVKICAEDYCIEVPNKETQNVKRLTKLPKKFQSYITELQSSENKRPSSDSEIKTKIFIPVLDHMLSELKRRFSDNSNILLGISSLNPKSEFFLNYERLKPLAENYCCDMDSLESEIKLLPKLLKRIESDTKISVCSLQKLIKALDSYKLAFHELYKLCIIAVTVPPSSAGCERTFSCLRQTKTYLRNKIGNERLSSLSVLAIERNIAKALDMTEVVNNFAAAHNNRRIQLV